MKSLVFAEALRIVAPSGRVLFDRLTLQLGRETVAVIGRNGVGKSILLATLAGAVPADRGKLTVAPAHLVPQLLQHDSGGRAGSPGNPGSPGQRRRAALSKAFRSGADVLLLDEPTEDLDEDAVAWFSTELRRWQNAALVVSHDPRVLALCRHFFIVDERGGYAFSGDFAELKARLELEARRQARQWTQSLQRMLDHEARALHLARRKARKKRYGRVSELDRATPKIRLNAKRGQAQSSHGKSAQIRQARIDAVRAWTHQARRAIEVTMPLTLNLPRPLAEPGEVAPVIVATQLSACVDGRTLFANLDLTVGNQKVAVVGPNGAGKSTLLAALLGERPPHVDLRGTVRRDARKLAAILQGGSNWMRDESLADLLGAEAAAVIAAHLFPLGLATRPMASLSPGERTRAALIACLHQPQPPQLLILDEPTAGLDYVGRQGLIAALAAWQGGLVVATHDTALVAAIGVTCQLAIGPPAKLPA